MGRQLGDPTTRCWSSVRSGAKFSMPGMMETVLNIGLNDAVVHGLAEQPGNERFAWDSYRRLMQMFGKTVLDIDGRPLRRRARRGQGTSRASARTSSSTADDAHGAGRHGTRTSSASTPAPDFPQDPREQLDLCDRGRLPTPGTPTAPSSTAARSASRTTSAPRSTCRPWCSATCGEHSGTGVAFTRDPATGAAGAYGDYLRTRRARTSSPASATPCRWTTWSSSTRSRTTSS